MKNIVLCGSMKVKDKIVLVARELEELGYNVLLPKECMEGSPKKIASFNHFSRIIDKNNEYVLVVNTSNNGIDNYIGPNSFAEIAFAFYYKKKIYLYNELYDQYRDELEGWGVKELKGDLNKIK